jgi:hypothetical protein
MALLSRSAALCQPVQFHPDVFRALKHDVSPPLRDIKPAPPVPGPPRVMQRLWARPPKITPAQRDTVLQTSQGPRVSATAGPNFEGINEVSQQIASGLLAVPPDTNSAVGETQIVQWVNYAFAVFDKSTGLVQPGGGPFAGNHLWTGFGGPCETTNSGDPVAQYDKAVGRWVLTQPVFTNNPFAICVAVSQTSDARGAYYRYAFKVPNFPDYPKLGIWPDAYYVSMDLYTGQGFGGKFLGANLCALDRLKMLAGESASMQCFPGNIESLDPSFASLLPSDLDGSTPPPAGSPNFFLNLGTDSISLNLWKFHVNFSDSTKSTLSRIKIPVEPFTEACGGGICIPQSGTKELLDSLGDRLMYRLAYRNFGDHESLVVNHSVTAVPTGSTVGVRWYEIRNPNGITPTVFQHGTFAPNDGNFRWMGSAAMDKFGDIAVGYSVSGSSINPQIRFTGRVPSDPLGMLEVETHIKDGTGSQLKLSNWGDYSSMSIDPVDDCTFWYTTEYLQTDGKYNWRTRIASFKFQPCY